MNKWKDIYEIRGIINSLKYRLGHTDDENEQDKLNDLINDYEDRIRELKGE